MKTHSIPDGLAEKYKGSGPALASFMGDTIIDLVYIRDLIPSFDGALSSVQNLIGDHRIGGAALKMQQGAELVSVGMVSAWEFTEL